ncbi:MAG: hypothetical protein V4436_00720 [Patescibacteria group bacterium]
MPQDRELPKIREELQAELTRRLDKVVDDLAKEKGVTRDEIIQNAIDFFSGKKK